MNLFKQIQLNDYKLVISIQSESRHAHALLTDYKNEIEDEIENMQLLLISLINKHRSKYERNNSEIG